MRRMALIATIAAFVVSATGADDSLGIDRAVASALANNAGILRARIALAAAGRAVDTSWNGLIPNLAIGAGTSLSGGAVSANGSASAGLSLTASALSAARLARLGYEAALLAQRIVERDVELQVRKSYYSLALARDNMAIIERSISTAQKSYDQAEAKRKAGMAPEIDSLTALVALERIKPTLANAKLSYENQLAVFKQLAGIPQETAVTLSDPLKALSPSGIAATILPATAQPAQKQPAPTQDAIALPSVATPAVATLEKSLEQAVAKKAAADAAVWSPGLSLSMEYRPTLSGSEWGDKGKLSASLSLSLDKLAPWSQARQDAATAADSVARLRSQLEEATLSAELSIKALRRRIEQAEASMKALSLTVTLAERSYALTEEAYRFGTRDILGLQSAQDSLQEARMRVLEESYIIISAVLDLEYALGVPFGTLWSK